MTAQDDPKEHQPPDTPPEVSNAERPLRRRIADTWNKLEPAATKAGAVVISVAAAVVVKGLIARSNTQTQATEPEEPTDPPTRTLTIGNGSSYYSCSHQGCHKKVNPTIFGHGCCGRCYPGRNCSNAAQRDYDGPGRVVHNYGESPLFRGVCNVCSEPREAHLWVFNHNTGERRAR